MNNNKDIDWDVLRQQVFLDPNHANLNAGSTSPGIKNVCARAAELRQFQGKEPVRFMWGESLKQIETSRQRLAQFLGCQESALFFFKNASTAANTALNSFPFESGDEVLTFNHEYIQILSHLRFLGKKMGFQIRSESLPHAGEQPGITPDDLVEMVDQAISPKTKLILLSHVTFTHGIRQPVEKIVARCRERGVATLIDGAHAVGQYDLELGSLDADFYAGACNKWLQNPVGAAFLMVNPKHRLSLTPLMVSAYHQHTDSGERLFDGGPTDFQYGVEYQGTEDRIAQVVLTDTLGFRATVSEKALRQRQREFTNFSEGLLKDAGMTPLHHSHHELRSCMTSYQIPKVQVLKTILHFRNVGGIEVSIPYDERGELALRISHSWWNQKEDFEKLARFVSDLDWTSLC